MQVYLSALSCHIAKYRSEILLSLFYDEDRVNNGVREIGPYGVLAIKYGLPQRSKSLSGGKELLVCAVPQYYRCISLWKTDEASQNSDTYEFV